MQHTNYDRILGILCSVLDAYSAALFLPEPVPPRRRGQAAPEPEGRPHYVASFFSLGDRLNVDADIREGKGLVGWILRNKEPLLVSNFDQRRNHLGYYSGGEESSIKAFMGCALPGGGGALCVDSKRQYSFAEKDQKLLYLFADLIERLQGEDEGRDERRLALRHYAALRTVYALRHQYSRWADFLRHFLDLMATVTGFSYTMLCTRDPSGESYSVEGENSRLVLVEGKKTPSFPMSQGVVGWVFRNSAQLCTDGAEHSPETMLLGLKAEQAQFQTVLALPLVIQRKTRGVLCLAHDEHMEIGKNTREFVSMATDHLALFLENLYVKCRLRDLHRSLEAGNPPPGE